jgi:TolB-like protein/Tfp pilus assembly protein PilF
MKRCPQCNRVETDEALKFCRADGTTLVNDSSSFNSEGGTAQLGSSPDASEVHTSILPQNTVANVNRVTAPTTVLPPQPTPSTTSELSKPKSRRTAIVVAVIAIAVVGISAIAVKSYRSRTTSGAAINSIAVMPFLNESGNADVEYLSDGMTETLIGSLSQLPNLNVKARATVFRYKGKEINPQAIGKELNVQAILNGRVAQRGDRLQLSLELIDAQTENVIWSDRYDRKQTDLIDLQNEIARDVSSKLRIKLSGADQQKLTKTYTTDPEVYRLYLQGRFYWNKRTNSEVEKAVTYFKQAVDKDPNFALGYVGLADSFEDKDRPTKKDYIRRALEIDDNLAEAHASLGYQYMCSQDWVASERELKRAIELNPNLPQAHAWNGARLMMIGRYDESLASIERALVIDPTANGINFYKAVCLAVSGRRAEAIQHFKKIIAMDPTFPWAHSFLSRVYRWNGEYAASVEERAISFELDGRAERATQLREAFAKGGWKSYQEELRRNNPNVIAAGELEQTERDRSIERLQSQAQEGSFWLFLIKMDPMFDPLRDDPRFQELVKKFDPPR